jgi:cytochrome c5
MTGKVPLVLADADAIVDGLELANTYLRSEDANTRAAQVGSGSASELARSVYGTFCELIENHWSDIAPHAEQHAYWGLRDQADLDLAKVKRRAVFTTLLLLPATEVEKLDSEGRWTKMKHRWEFLLDLLESQGCFILRRGTIESYYDECGRDSPAADKPAAAATEASRIADAPENMLAERYADVLRCLRRAAQTQPIVEAESLQDPLLAVAAPALARIKNGASSDSLNPLARSIVGDTSKLFDLSVAEGKLRIDLKSQVLNVQGFPLEIAQDDDLIRYVSRALGTASA